MDNLEYSSRNVFVSAEVDRLAKMRHDPQWLHAQLKNENSRFIPVWQDLNLFSSLESWDPVVLEPCDLNGFLDKTDSLILLGTDGSHFFWALDLPEADAAIPDQFQNLGVFRELRKGGFFPDRLHRELLVCAKAMTFWHGRTRFCGKCGHPTTSSLGGHVRICANKNCNQQHFPRTDPAVIALVTYQERCLLGRQARWPKSLHSIIAGFLEPGESLEHCVVREVREETGVPVTKVSYHSSQPWPFPNSIMLGFNAEAAQDAIQADGHEIEKAQWFSRTELRSALQDGSLVLPTPISIAYRLIEDWFDAADLGKLSDVIDSKK